MQKRNTRYIITFDLEQETAKVKRVRKKRPKEVSKGDACPNCRDWKGVVTLDALRRCIKCGYTWIHRKPTPRKALKSYPFSQRVRLALFNGTCCPL